MNPQAHRLAPLAQESIVRTRRKKCCLMVCMATVCAPLAGCFNAESMIESRRAGALSVEVDLGKFRISLPQPAETTAVAEIQFHAFGQVAHRNLNFVEESLEKNGPEIRHRLLLATRQLKPHEIEDPGLVSLRLHIASVLNELLPDEPLQTVGFYHFRFSNF